MKNYNGSYQIPRSEGGDDLTITHTGISIIQSTDYYPGGLVMREQKDEDYRFGYQGQFSEYDSTIKMNQFQLRLYNPVTWRWNSTDPYRQYYSPYMSMGNNPNNRVDPDGGLDWKPDENGNLVAERGDNAATLADYLGISFEDALGVYNNLGNWDGGMWTGGMTGIIGRTLDISSVMPNWMQTAVSQLGTSEGPILVFDYYTDLYTRASLNLNNPSIMNYFSYTTYSNAPNDEVPWCSAFCNYVTQTSGVGGTNRANAQSWINYGMESKPQLGAIVVFWSGSASSTKGHVGLVHGINPDGTLNVLGGNQGNMVKISKYNNGITTYSNGTQLGVMGFRMPNN